MNEIFFLFFELQQLASNKRLIRILKRFTTFHFLESFNGCENRDERNDINFRRNEHLVLLTLSRAHNESFQCDAVCLSNTKPLNVETT